MKTTRTLIAVLTLLVSLVSYVSGQNGEFEGSAETGLGNDRCIDYTNDTKINFNIIEGTGTGTVTQKTAQCVLLNLPVIGFNFKGNDFTRAYICANGLVKFYGRSYEVNPRNFGTYGGQRSDSACLAPYWSFVNLDHFQTGESKVLFRKYEDSDNDFRSVFSKATQYGNTIFGILNYNPIWVTVITWVDLRPKQPGFTTYGGRNTFQLFLANGANNDAIAVYCYKDIDWSVGVLRNDYEYYIRSSDLPVVGFNSGEEDDEDPYDNFAKSGTIDVEEVDDYVHTVLQRRGEIGISLKQKVVTPPTSAEICRTWVNQQIYSGRTRYSCVNSCAPTLSLARYALGGRFFYLYRTFKDGYSPFPNYCIYSNRWRRQDADECCYTYYGHPFFYYISLYFGTFRGFVLNSAPAKGAGHWHPYHPRRNYFNYLQEQNSYRDCCTKPDSTLLSCAAFYSIRPTCKSVFWFFPTQWASMFGDPHFVSLDGKNYTFNGCGWFTYFTGEIPGNNESSLVVQVRTTRVGNVNATGFTGIAVKEGNTEVVQVNLIPGGGLLIRVNGNDFTPGPNATALESGIVLSLANNTFEIGTLLGNGVRIKEAANGTFFTFVTAFLSSYENSSLGLAGKWNGNMEDDFTLPDQTVLPINMNDSEIFYNFGEAWRVQNSSKIYENIDDNIDEYKCPVGFVPIFFDQALADMPPSLRTQADEVCGNDLSCLFDIAATNDVSIGASTLLEITTINNEIAEVENRLPVFTHNFSVINVTLGATFNLVLEAEDPDDDDLTFDVPVLPPGASFSSSGNQLFFSWPVNSAEPANLTILVQDSKNGTATLSPSIQLCRCENGGDCYVPEASSQQTAAIQNTFLVMSCNCFLGYTGEFCGDVRDFCAGELTPPCNPLVTCANSPTGFTCGDCPNGYEGNGQICLDIDECEGNQTVCDQICTNTVSSYFCGCNDGFSLDSDERTCSDIDECSKPNNCSQLCNNTIGSFECYCRIGFLIDPDDPTSCTAKTQCDGSNDCAQICYIDPLQAGQERCDCNLGYSLRESDMESCDDINECQNTQDNLCDQLCTNTQGSYTCSCLAGYAFTSPATCTDINECATGDFACNGIGEECENIPGNYRCACSKRLNMVRVNGTCIFREDDSIVADLAPAPPSATEEQTNNAIQITLANFQEVNYTVDADVLFKDSVVKLLNDFCNENSLRPQDCGVEQNQLLFSELNVKRVPGYPSNEGDNAIIRFYVDYPSIVRNATLDQAILASIVFAELQKFQDLTGFSITLDTSVVPAPPPDPTTIQNANAVQLQISSFSVEQWTTFYDTVFRRAVAVTLNKYCEVDSYSRTQDCGLSDSESFDLDDIARLPNNPSQSGENVQVSFYVNHPSNADPVVLQSVLASMLVTRESDLEGALSQQVEILTSAAPDGPPTATADQTTNSVVIRISSFDASRWTYLNDRRLRTSIASRVATYCGGDLVDCQIQTGGTASFIESNVQRTSSATPSDAGDNSIDYSFYVKYPSGDTPIIQYILASVVNIELDAMQSESSLFFSLQTSFQPPTPATPNADQSSNTVDIKIINQQANQWHGIQDNQLRAAIATQIASYCTSNLVTCGVTSDQVSFNSSHVTRLVSSPLQDGDNVTYTFFVDYPSGNGPIQGNLLAGILTTQIGAIETAMSLDLSVETSTLAASPPVANPDQISNATVVNASSIQANQWSAVQDNKFRGYVAQAIAEYCQASESQTQDCELPGDQASFTTSHVQLVPGSPSQDGLGADIQFYVDYPGGGTMSQAILLLIVNEKLASIATNTGLDLTLETTAPPPPTAPPPSPENTDNAINVVLKDFQADQWSFRDALFRENMAAEIKAFCGMSTYHRDICNISDADVNGFTSDHIRRLPNSPTQNGTDSILSFYAVLPSGSVSLPSSVLATIFTSQQDKILSLDSELEDPGESIPSSETPVLTPNQTQNIVAITILNFNSRKVNTLVVVDIRVTVAGRMNRFCFSTPGDVCGLAIIARRKKRAVGDQQFSQNDVIVDGNSVMDAGNNTVLGVVVNEPGRDTPVENNIVEDALYQTIQEDGQSEITNLTIGVVNVPTVSDNQRDNAISVRLTGTQTSEWTLQQDISFRSNMSQAIVQFCGQSDARLASCGLTRDQLNDIDFLNIQILSNSPTQDGNDSVLSFFVNLPDGTTMPSDLLRIIYSSSPNVISQPTAINMTVSQNPNLTTDQTENLVQLTVIGLDPTQDVRLDVQVTISNRLNGYCSNNSGAAICPTNGNFTNDDVLVQINSTTGSVSFVVINPEIRSPVPASTVQDAISGDIISDLLGLTFTVPPSTSSIENAIDVVLKDFVAEQWSSRDRSFRQNMTNAIKAFCGVSEYHGAICNISDADLNGFTSDHIRRLPNSPTQNGTDSILSFYAVLPSGSGSLPSSVLATIFTSEQEKILSVNSELEDPSESISSSETPALTPTQTQNKVAITIFNFKRAKVNTLVVVDIRVTVAARMNLFCFSTPGNVCGFTNARRKKRAVGDQQFTQNDVIVDGNTVMDAGDNTVLGVVVNEPGKDTPVEKNIVEDALYQTIQENGQSEITNLTLGVVNIPTVSDNQRDNAISVRLANTQTSEWTLQQDISFRNNMSQAIVQFCGQNDARLASCGLTRNQLGDIGVQNIQILPNSPTQDGNDSVLSFFVNLPDGTTMPSDLLRFIYSSSPNVISQDSQLTAINTTTSQNPVLTTDQTENLVQVTVNGLDPTTPTQDVRLDVQITIANRLNGYCRNNSGAAICPTTGTFTKDDVLVQIDNATGSVSFVVIDPQTKTPVPGSGVQDAINGEFKSDLLGLTFTVPQSTGAGGDDEVDWPLILGLSIGGALLFLFVILSIIIGVVNTSEATRFKEYDFENESVYSARGWQFDRESPYSGSPFASIDAIPGFDEDGLPSDARPTDTRV